MGCRKSNSLPLSSYPSSSVGYLCKEASEVFQRNDDNDFEPVLGFDDFTLETVDEADSACIDYDLCPCHSKPRGACSD